MCRLINVETNLFPVCTSSCEPSAPLRRLRDELHGRDQTHGDDWKVQKIVSRLEGAEDRLLMVVAHTPRHTTFLVIFSDVCASMGTKLIT